MNVFSYHNPNSNIRKDSSSGGLFSTLAEKYLQEDGVVYGASFDNDWNVVHRRIDTEDDIDLLRRSKYVYSKLEKIIVEVCKDIDSGKKVLFCSLPCQIAAIRKRIGENPNLICMELVCHGAPESKYWDRYLNDICRCKEKRVSEIQSINFRDKKKGWKNYYFTIKFKDGTEFSEPHDQNRYMRAFIYNYTLRNACFSCKFKYPKGSQADLTIGDFWGISEIAPELNNDLGTSIVIARTNLGKESILGIKYDKEINFDDIIKYNPAICSSAKKPLNIIKFREDFDRGQNTLQLFKKYTNDSLLKRITLRLYRIIRR